MVYLKAAIAMTLGVHASMLFVDCNLFSNLMFHSCEISTDIARSLCNRPCIYKILLCLDSYMSLPLLQHFSCFNVFIDSVY